ncbi:disks large homolog 5 isoform X2 [Esox lucius]|uniref:disks large homolog 5 isoform X2 n=1 Tax=Esox lucius TaxID=8010 RepID=UPI001476D6F8|nr:disks large homolog 5 isoform X2 [Esox lucius]
MESKHKELLDKCYQNLLESITDADRVVEALFQTGTLCQSECYELGHDCSSNSEKVDLLLKMLMSKERDHFQDLCAALEKTHPHLNSTLLFNGDGPVDHSSGSTYSVLSTMPSDSESSSSLSSVGTTGQASSPPPAHLETRCGQVSEKMETVLFQLRQVTRERDELRKRLALSSPGTTFDDCRPNFKSGHDYERLKLQCLKAMGDLQSLQNQHSTSLKRCEEAVQKADFYHSLHSRVASEQAQLKEELEAVRQDNIQLIREHNHLKLSCEEMRRRHEEDQRELGDMRLLHQQVMRAGSSEILNKLYDTAMDKLEGAKRDYEVLKKRYNEKTAHHNADLSHLEQAEMENQRLQKQLDVLLKQRDAAMHYQQQYSTSMRRFDSTQAELSKVAVHNNELQREMERLQAENTRLKTQQLKAVKDCDKYKEERDSVFSEYRLIMSERDQVIKEVDKLQTGLELAEAKLKNTTSERRMTGEELEALRQELGSALIDRDRAICEKNELLEKYCHEVKDKAETQKELSQACKDIETVREERDVARKERTEAITQRDQLLREYYQARQIQDSATVDMERATKEIEVLRKQYEAMSLELKEAAQEAEVAKCRRDWAFQERDKIVAERESIRTLCDNLRRERDRAVSDLADVLRNLDDARKQKNDVSRELKELKEKLEDQLAKEARFQQLVAHNSHDSAIDTDSLEWETEVVELEKNREDMDLKALGFDVAKGLNDPYLPGDCGIFVSKVAKGSIAEGRLRVNDWLLKINNVDLANKDRKQVLKAVLSGEGVINVVVRRKKCLGGRLITPIQISLTGYKDSGIGLECGVFIAGVIPGSPSSREGSLTVGDRLIAINGIALDNKSLSECESLLCSCREVLSVSVIKFLPQSCSAQSLFENLGDASEKVSNCRSLHSGPEVHSRNCRNSRHHSSSTQTEMFCPDAGSSGAEGHGQNGGQRDSVEHDQNGDGSFCRRLSKPFSTRSLQSRCPSHRGRCGPCSPLGPEPSEPHQDYCYTRPELHRRQAFTFSPPVASDCILRQSRDGDGDMNRGGCGEEHIPSPEGERLSGGTWPKITSFPEGAQLSIYKKPSQRKSIFDVDTFKRPETPTKLDYLSLSQLPKHSPQNSSEAGPVPGVGIGQIPPTPPQRSDSFRFRHRQQTSSASDSTITTGTGTPPATPGLDPGGLVPLGRKQEGSDPEGRERDRERDWEAEQEDRDLDSVKQHYYIDLTQERKQPISNSRMSCDEEVGRHRGGERDRGRRRYRPKSAPSLRRNMPPLHLHIPVQVHSFSNDEASPEPVDLVRFSPMRSPRYSAPIVTPEYGSNTVPNPGHRGPAPCPAVTAVMRNPVYTAWSHDVHTNNSNYPPPPSAQHQCQLSLDVTHKRSGDLTSDSSSSSQAPHSTSSLPSRSRLESSGHLKFRTERIRIPSTRCLRSTGFPDRGSLSQSECSSLSHSTPPTSPVNPDTPTYTSSQSQSSISTSASQPRMSVSPAPTRDHRKDRYGFYNRSFLHLPLTARPRFSSLRSLRPYLEEPRTVAVQKGTEPLGISIVNGESGGVFVSKVTAGSIAHQARLEYGDQLLEFNGINLRNANEQQARLVIGQQCDTITILAQYNPHMFQQGIHSRSSSRMESISGQPAPQLSGATTPDRHFAVDTLSEQEEGTVTPPSNRTSPAHGRDSSFRHSSPGVDSHHPPGVRLVQLKKTQVDLGLQICGGNLSGIYVESLENDSPANCPDGLLPGDQILEYNGVTMKDMTTEEAYLEMLKPSDTVAFKVQHCSDELMMVKNSPGDGFYIRALYDRVAENELELSFKKDDILYVEDTLPNGTFGVWTAWQLDETARRLARGQIPSKYTMDQESCSRHSIPDGRDESGGKTLSAAARRSFFRRKQKHKRSGSKDGKDLATLDDIGTDSLTVTEDGLCLAYQRVQKVVCSRPRPVLILGPLVEANKDMLVKEAPGRFCRCPPEVMKASQQAIERGVKDCVFIDYKRRSGHFDVTTVAAIKEITEKDCHCLLDTAPHAIERLHSVHIYPIVIFIRYKNAKQIKEQKDHQYLRDKVSQKHSKEQFEMALKIEQEYSKFFTSVIQGGTLAYICTQVMNIVDQEQNKVLWIPEGAL